MSRLLFCVSYLETFFICVFFNFADCKNTWMVSVFQNSGCCSIFSPIYERIILCYFEILRVFIIFGKQLRRVFAFFNSVLTIWHFPVRFILYPAKNLSESARFIVLQKSLLYIVFYHLHFRIIFLWILWVKKQRFFLFYIHSPIPGIDSCEHFWVQINFSFYVFMALWIQEKMWCKP